MTNREKLIGDLFELDNATLAIALSQPEPALPDILEAIKCKSCVNSSGSMCHNICPAGDDDCIMPFEKWLDMPVSTDKNLLFDMLAAEMRRRNLDPN